MLAELVIAVLKRNVGDVSRLTFQAAMCERNEIVTVLMTTICKGNRP